MKNCSDCGAAFNGADFLCPKCKESPLPQAGYDSYYNDVLPEDASERNNRKPGSGIAVKIGLTVFGVVLAIAACIAVLSLL